MQKNVVVKNSNIRTMRLWNFTTCTFLQVFISFILFQYVACEKKSCPDPGVSKHGTRDGGCCSSGNGLLFSCEDGYELVGQKILLCLSTGVWSSPRPLCRPLQDHCELPPKIQHGIITGERGGDYFLPGEKAQVLCDPGYACKGPEFVVCKEGGEFESEFGECTEKLCETPSPLAHGTIPELQSTSMTSLPDGSVITYVCDKGYGLIGNRRRICMKGGWSGKPPYCEDIQCPDPGIPENGYKLGDNYVVGSSVHFSCFFGYHLLGSVDRYCMPNGRWTGELSRCDSPGNYCPNPGIPIKGSKNSTRYDFGDKVRFDCQQGYILLGSEVRQCLTNHTWSGTEAKCLGPYDFDNGAHVRDILNVKFADKAEEQRMQLQKYQKALQSSWLNGSFPVGGTLDLNYPGRLILYFAFDVSDSIGSMYFEKSIQFAKAIVKKVGISENGARAGALTFSSEAEMMFSPINFHTTQGVLDALDKIPYTGGGGSAPNSVFSLIKYEYKPLVDELLGKTNVKSVIFLLTDGKANMVGSPTEEADILKKAGVEIYCIGITVDLRFETLYDAASKSKNAIGEEYANVYILQNYPTLAWLIQEITNGTKDYSLCGLGLENVDSKEDQARIVGGKTSKEPWPWMAALYMSGDKVPARYKIICGGSIIHRHFILTAAQCMYDTGLKRRFEQRGKKTIKIKLGLTDLENEAFVQEFEVFNMSIHPRYIPGDYFDYDIALLQLDRPIEYNAFIRPVCLPPKELPDESLLYRPLAAAWATGWGHKGKVQKHEPKSKFRNSRNLKLMYLPIQSRDSCQESLGSIGANASLFTDRMLCAGDGKGLDDACYGDSGGPLMQSQLNSDGFLSWTQVGIISWGIGCQLIDTYGYYTHLQKFVPWIEDTIGDALKDM